MTLAVGIEAEILATGRPTGVERALRLWLDELPRLPGVRVLAFFRSGGIGIPPPAEGVRLPSPLPLPLWRELVLPGALRRAGAHVLLSPVTAFPLRSPVPVVATIHELPWLEAGCGPPPPRERWRALLALRRAATVLAVSTATARRCLELARSKGLPPPRLRVVRHGFRPLAGGELPLPAADRPALAVSLAAPRPRKDLAGHLKLFARARAAAPGARYILVGPEGKARDHLLALAAGLGLEGHVILPGYMTDSAVATLLGRAAVLLHLPLSEGFGFPPLEALALGCLPCLSRRGGLPEVCRDAALYLEGPGAPDLLARALMEPGTREPFLARAPAALARRDPGRAARRLAQVLAEAAGRPPASCPAGGELS